MIRCSHCDDRIPRDSLCSDLAVITLHWMERHPAAYVQLHPESAPNLAGRN